MEAGVRGLRGSGGGGEIVAHFASWGRSEIVKLFKIFEGAIELARDKGAFCC